MFPLLSGEYKFSVIIKNEVSKEFTSLERDIIIPEDDSSLRMSSLILGYNVKQLPPESTNLAPFKIGQDQMYLEPKKIFHPKDKLILSLQILGLSSDLRKRGIIKFEFFRGDELFFDFSKKLSEYPLRSSFKQEFSLERFQPDHYRIIVSLMDETNELLKKWGEFDVTSVSKILRPWVYYKKLLPSSDPVYSFILGKQHFNKGEIKKAKDKFEIAYHENPNSLDYALGLAQAYFTLKKYDKAGKILSPFLESKEAPYQLYFLLGKSHQALGKFDQAVSVYNEAISHFGINFNLLNSLGECYYRLGSTDEALAAWKKSLEINSEQPEIRKKIESIRK